MGDEIRFDNYSRKIDRREVGGKKYDWYDWELFVDAPPETLAKISSVEYRLHETFPKPIRVVDDPRTKFALRSLGWGGFTVRILVSFKDGSSRKFEYELDLSKPWPRNHQ